MSRDGLGSFDFLFLAFVLAVILGSGFLIRFLPARMIDVPNRDYWFAPERSRQSHTRMFSHMLWFACLMVGFLIAVNHLVFLTNLRPGQPRLPGAAFITLLVGFLVAVIAWGMRLYRLFPRPPVTAPPKSDRPHLAHHPVAERVELVGVGPVGPVPSTKSGGSRRTRHVPHLGVADDVELAAARLGDLAADEEPEVVGQIDVDGGAGADEIPRPPARADGEVLLVDGARHLHHVRDRPAGQAVGQPHAGHPGARDQEAVDVGRAQGQVGAEARRQHRGPNGTAGEDASSTTASTMRKGTRMAKYCW